MRISRPLWLFVIGWSVLCGVGLWVVRFGLGLFEPEPPGCWEWCGFGESMGSYFLIVITVAWAVVTAIAFVVDQRVRRRLTEIGLEASATRRPAVRAVTEAAGAPVLRAVFLDIGDTIMRPNPSWEHVYALAFEEFSVKVEMEDLHKALRNAYHHGGWGMDGGFDPSEETSFQRTVSIDAAAIAALGLEPMPEAFFRRLAELFMVTSHWHIFPDAYPTLTALKERGLVVGAVSNWVWNLPELLHALDLVSGFDFIAASARIGFEKPHPRIFEWALEQADVPPESVIHVGDHVDADVEGARGVGISAVLIDRSHRFQPEDVPDGVPVIHGLGELLPIVDARLADR